MALATVLSALLAFATIPGPVGGVCGIIARMSPIAAR